MPPEEDRSCPARAFQSPTDRQGPRSVVRNCIPHCATGMYIAVFTLCCCFRRAKECSVIGTWRNILTQSSLLAFRQAVRVREGNDVISRHALPLPPAFNLLIILSAFSDRQVCAPARPPRQLFAAWAGDELLRTRRRQPEGAQPPVAVCIQSSS